MAASRRTDNLPAPLTTFVGRLPRSRGDRRQPGTGPARHTDRSRRGGQEQARPRSGHPADRAPSRRRMAGRAGRARRSCSRRAHRRRSPRCSRAGRTAQTAALTERLRDSDMLICLDNCEHLLDPVARLVQDLLAGCRSLRILITSRERLGLTGEKLWPVAGLSAPPDDDEQAGHRPGVRRRTAVPRPGHRRRPRVPAHRVELPAVADICRRLDGLPLAIELAAARVNSLGVEQISRRLDNRFGLLAAESRGTLPHHRTPAGRGRVELPDAQRPRARTVRPARRVRGQFRRGVRRGGGRRPGRPRGHHRIAAQTDRQVPGDRHPEARARRYRLLETLRAYGLERLGEAAGDRSAARPARRVLRGTRRAGMGGYRGPDQPDWLDRLEAEHTNLRAALDW